MWEEWKEKQKRPGAKTKRLLHLRSREIYVVCLVVNNKAIQMMAAKPAACGYCTVTSLCKYPTCCV